MQPQDRTSCAPTAARSSASRWRPPRRRPAPRASSMSFCATRPARIARSRWSGPCPSKRPNGSPTRGAGSGSSLPGNTCQRPAFQVPFRRRRGRRARHGAGPRSRAPRLLPRGVQFRRGGAFPRLRYRARAGETRGARAPRSLRIPAGLGLPRRAGRVPPALPQRLPLAHPRPRPLDAFCENQRREGLGGFRLRLQGRRQRDPVGRCARRHHLPVHGALDVVDAPGRAPASHARCGRRGSRTPRPRRPAGAQVPRASPLRQRVPRRAREAHRADPRHAVVQRRRLEHELDARHPGRGDGFQSQVESIPQGVPLRARARGGSRRRVHRLQRGLRDRRTRFAAGALRGGAHAPGLRHGHPRAGPLPGPHRLRVRPRHRRRRARHGQAHDGERDARPDLLARAAPRRHGDGDQLESRRRLAAHVRCRPALPARHLRPQALLLPHEHRLRCLRPRRRRALHAALPGLRHVPGVLQPRRRHRTLFLPA